MAPSQLIQSDICGDKTVTRIFEEFCHFTAHENGAIFGVLCAQLSALLIGWGGALRKHLTELAVSASACHAGKYHNEEPQDKGQQADMFE